MLLNPFVSIQKKKEKKSLIPSTLSIERLYYTMKKSNRKNRNTVICCPFNQKEYPTSGIPN